MRQLIKGILPLSLAFSFTLNAQVEDKLDHDLQQVQHLVQVLEQVHQNHPDTEKLDYARLVNYALEGALSSLDRFSYYYHPETYQAISEDESLDLEVRSLGLTLGQRESGLYIIAVTDHSPAAKAGIRAGDSLDKLNDESTKQIPLTTALKNLRGEVGETVKLELTGKDTREPYTIELVHRVTRNEPVQNVKLLDDNKTGYIYLSEFTASADVRLAAALDDLEARGMKQLIIDMRGNPGGLLDVAVKMLAEFVPPSTKVVTTQSRVEGDQQGSFVTPERKRRDRNYPLAVLVDRNSASAAELFPGTLQDLKRATIVGETTYGKGSVQNIQPLGNGAALRLTIATYHTPSGRTPHKVGITPDVEVSLTEQDRENAETARRPSGASPEALERLNNWTDPVLAAALESFQK